MKKKTKKTKKTKEEEKEKEKEEKEEKEEEEEKRKKKRKKKGRRELLPFFPSSKHWKGKYWKESLGLLQEMLHIGNPTSSSGGL